MTSSMSKNFLQRNGYRGSLDTPSLTHRENLYLSLNISRPRKKEHLSLLSLFLLSSLFLAISQLAEKERREKYNLSPQFTHQNI